MQEKDELPDPRRVRETGQVRGSAAPQRDLMTDAWGASSSVDRKEQVSEKVFSLIFQGLLNPATEPSFFSLSHEETQNSSKLKLSLSLHVKFQREERFPFPPPLSSQNLFLWLPSPHLLEVLRVLNTSMYLPFPSSSWKLKSKSHRKI